MNRSLQALALTFSTVSPTPLRPKLMGSMPALTNQEPQTQGGRMLRLLAQVLGNLKPGTLKEAAIKEVAITKTIAEAIKVTTRTRNMKVATTTEAEVAKAAMVTTKEMAAEEANTTLAGEEAAVATQAISLRS